MQQPQFRIVDSPALLAEAAGNGRQPQGGYRPPFEELWWEAGPAVLSAIDSAGDRIPRQIGVRLQDWISRAISEDPVTALDLAALDQAFRDLSTFHLACYTYRLVPDPTPQLPHDERVVMTDRGYVPARQAR
jgi:hypothetical protein